MAVPPMLRSTELLLPPTPDAPADDDGFADADADAGFE